MELKGRNEKERRFGMKGVGMAVSKRCTREAPLGKCWNIDFFACKSEERPNGRDFDRAFLSDQSGFDEIDAGKW